MKIKKVKSSKRGLTFSLEGTYVQVSARFRYVLDVKNNPPFKMIYLII